MEAVAQTRMPWETTMLVRVAQWLKVSPDDLASLDRDTLGVLDRNRALTQRLSAWQREQDEAEQRGE